MRHRRKAMRAAIGLAVLAAHFALILVLSHSRSTREPETAADTAVAVYLVAAVPVPVHQSAQLLGRTKASAHATSTHAAGREAAARAVKTRGSRHENRRAAVLARRQPPRTQTARTQTARADEQPERLAGPTDWNSQVEQAAKQEVAREESARQRASALSRPSGVSAAISAALLPPPPKVPEFGWAPPRVKVVNGVGIFVRLNDHCAVLISGMVMPICTFGKIPVHGDLFAHMNDARNPLHPGLP